MSADVMPALNGSGHLLDDHIDAANRYTNAGPLDDCWHCGAPRRHGQTAHRGLCSRCYHHWHEHGFAGHAPPPLRQRTGYVASEQIGWGVSVRDPYVLHDFARLDNPSIPGRTAELCRRFGVTRRTLSRWRARLNKERRRAELLALARSSCGRTRWRNRLRAGAGSGREVWPDEGSPVAAMVAAQVLDQTSSSPARVACFRA